MKLNVVLNGKKVDNDDIKLLILNKAVAAIYSSTFKHNGYTYFPYKLFTKMPYEDEEYIDRNFNNAYRIENPENPDETKVCIYSEIFNTMYIADMDGELKKDYVELEAKVNELPVTTREMIKYIFDLS